MFFGYTYRWTAIRDHNAPIWAGGWSARLNPVQRQLLGGFEAGGGDCAWGHYPDRTPLYEAGDSTRQIPAQALSEPP